MSEVAAVMAAVRAHPWLSAILARGDAIGLPDAWIVAGAVAQSVWNAATGRTPIYGIADIDVIWHDAADVSEESEAAIAARLTGMFGSIPVRIDAKNQARVHLWYAQKFGRGIAPHPSSVAAMATYPATATCVGVRLGPGEPVLAAPRGLSDLLGCVIRPNPVIVSQAVYEAKAARWKGLWPELKVLPWREDPAPCG